MSDQCGSSDAEAVKTAIATPALCTSQTVNNLKCLFAAHDTHEDPNKTGASISTKAATRTTSRATNRSTGRTTATTTTKAVVNGTSKGTSKPPSKTTRQTARNAPTRTLNAKDGAQIAIPVFADAGHSQILGPKEKQKLATDVVNIVLKVLTDALKQQPKSITKEAAIGKDHAKRASSTRAMTDTPPLAELPNQAAPSRRTSSSSISPFTSMVECARLAFSQLRKSTLGTPAALNTLKAMTAFVGKLLGHDMYSVALKELRISKICLEKQDNHSAQSTLLQSANEKDTPAAVLSVHLLHPTKDLHQLLVTHHAHVVKFITATKRPSIIESAVQYIDPALPDSPSAIIQHGLEHGEQTDKVVKQLELLARNILSMCPTPTLSANASADNFETIPSPDAVFKLQVFALVVRKQWWALASHKPNLAKELYEPLSSYLDSYRRSSPQSSAEKYETAQSMIARLLSLDKAPLASKSITSGLYSIYRSLSLLAQSNARTSDALAYIELMATACTDSPGLSACCSLRSLTIQLGDSDKPITPLAALLQSIRPKVHAQINNLSESSEIFRAIFSENAALRKAAASLLAVGISNNRTDDMDFLCEIVIFCTRSHSLILSRTLLPKKGPSLLHPMVLKSVDLFVNSSLTACNFLLQSQQRDPHIISSVLADCCDLLCAVNDGTSGPRLVTISNMYWRCYQLQSDIKLLKKSIDLLRGCNVNEQKLGFLSIKLGKLGSISTASDHHAEAYDVFSEALETQLASLSLVEMSRSILLGAKMRKELGLQSLVLCLHNYHEAALQQSCDTYFYDHDRLSPPERAVVLEVQIPIFEQYVHSRSQRKVFGPQFALLLTRLQEIYAHGKNPIREAHLYTCMLRLAKEYVDLFDSVLVQQACEYRFPDEKLLEDQGLEPYRPYVTASLSLAQTLCENSPSLAVVLKTCAEFRSIVEDSQSWQELGQRVADVHALTSQLRTIESFMALKGEDENCLDILKLLRRIHELEEPRDVSADTFTASQLAATYLRMGYSGRANEIVRQVEDVIGQHTISAEDRLRLDLVKVQIGIATGNLDTAKAAALSVEQLLPSLEHNTDQTRIAVQQLRTEAAFVFSLVSQHFGNIDAAFMYANRCAKLSLALLGYLERRHTPQCSGSSQSMDDLTRRVEDLSMTDARGQTGPAYGPAFWSIIPSFVRNLIHAYNIYAYSGRRFEAEYYAEQARKLASAIDSVAVTTQVLSVDARHAYALGEVTPDYKIPSLVDIEKAGNPLEIAKLHLITGDIRTKCQSWSSANASYETARALTMKMLTKTFEDRTQSSQKQPEARRQARKAIAKKKESAPPKRTALRKNTNTAAKGKASAGEVCDTMSGDSASFEESLPINDLCAQAITRKALMLMHQGQREKAVEYLNQTHSMACGFEQKTMQSIAGVRLLMLKSAEEAAADFTFNVLPESTLSFPALSSDTRRKSHSEGHRSSLLSPLALRGQQAVSPRKGGRKKPVSNSFTASLSEARDQIWKLQSEVAQNGRLSVCYRICELALQCSVLLSAIDTEIPTPKLHPSRAALSMELPRIEAFRRDLTHVDIDNRSAIGRDALTTSFDSMPHLSTAKFQQDYIDIIPESWAAVSLSMSEDCTELYIIRYQARMTPFIVRLPMVRHKLQDLEDESDGFDFEAARTELREIVDLSNFTCRSSHGITKKGAAATWWAEREALDLRMQELLVNIESIWLGGFRGILSQHRRDPRLLARFRKSLEGILDRHLPSRQGTKSHSKRLSLDSNVLQLFIGLGDDQEGEVDIDDHLLDLLYFVIDVLQFNGERNAYDEVDFDGMATETLDALRAYHEAAGIDNNPGDEHLILILDKRLHAFPWESLPCLETASISRVGSMLTLRERILAVRKQQTDTDRYLVPRHSGTYILNPGSDLASTQTVLGPILASVKDSNDSTWKAIVNHEPTEQEFSKALTRSSMLLYFGHGSGNQYIRNRAIKRLDKCSEVVWLIGCSSGTVMENGDFEPTSVPMSYMMAGRLQTYDQETSEDTLDAVEGGRDGLCMAVVATLWDVTDKDIDRFSAAVGDEWGLWSSVSVQKKEAQALQEVPKTPAKRGRPGSAKTPKKTAARSRSRAAAKDSEMVKKKSLVQAVVKGREACNLKYLNGAATVVYGVPVYLGD